MYVVLLKTGNRLLDVAPFVLVVVLVSLQVEHQPIGGSRVVNSSRFQVQCSMLINVHTVVLMKTGIRRLLDIAPFVLGCCVVRSYNCYNKWKSPKDAHSEMPTTILENIVQHACSVLCDNTEYSLRLNGQPGKLRQFLISVIRV